MSARFDPILGKLRSRDTLHGQELIDFTNLKNNEYKVLYWEAVGSQSGQVSAPTGATILLSEFQQGVHAVVETIVSGKPSGESPVDALGNIIVVSSFDVNGNYSLSDVPVSYPVAVLFIFKIKAVDWPNLDLNKVLVYEKIELADEATDIAGTSNTVASTPAGRSAWWATEKGAANGVAPLGSDSKVAEVYLPPVVTKSIFHINSEIVHTGTTAETIVYNSSPNLVGIIQANDHIDFWVSVSGSNTAGAKDLKFYISDSQSSLSNEVMIGHARAGTGWANSALVGRYLKMITINSNLHHNPATFLNLNNRYATALPILSNNIDFSTGAKYLIMTATCFSAGTDVITIHEGYSQNFRP
jgi:hypothetical protein